jgi:hypothetical protein
MKVPHARGVDAALRSVEAAARRTLKGLNQAASKRMAKGDYGGTEALAAKGREIGQFQSAVEELRRRWRELCDSGDGGSKEPVTPLWAYYQPILQALVQLGGQARRTELEPQVERLMSTSLQAGDRDTLARGRERWQVMIQRARKHLVSEGWVNDGRGKVWIISEAGRQVAERPTDRVPSRH